MSTLISAADAYKIAEVHPQRWREAVSAGNYPRAPEGIPFTGRRFREEDVIALRIYANLIDEGFPPRLAGRFSDLVLDGLESDPNAERVSVGYLYVTSDKAERTPRLLKPLKPGEAPGYGNVARRFEFNIARERQIIRDALRREAQRAGKEGGAE